MRSMDRTTPDRSSRRPNTERSPYVQEVSMTTRSYRPFSTIRNSIDIEEMEARHKTRVDTALGIFSKTEKKQNTAYIKTHIRPRVIPGLGRRMKDKGVIETIMSNRLDQWRQGLQEGKDVTEIDISVVKRSRLPHENPKKQRKKQHQPVFYWG